MSHTGTTKAQVLDSLSSLNPPLSLMVNSCRHIGLAQNQLPAFKVVAKNLPVLTDVFYSIENRLQLPAAETDQVSGKYPVIYRAAIACGGRIQLLESLFQAVNNSQNKDDAYRHAVGQGKTLEKVMEEMLQDALSAAVLPLVEREHVAALNRALEQVKSLSLSLEGQSRGAHITCNNSGEGHQFNQNGGGGMYNCSSGFQVNGPNDGATYNYWGRQESNK
ncbi:hypothetical protein CDV36_012999 [Fusarium kuroshium]|uniref:NACHT-NTPase and P-loop NTPases N-terminal domain-containing protein n=3 Tax=Fusarium solani species complex TaxID=232080 RepID=A0A3M2RQ97_9HYPO|nr:hypothetical protein CDV36_012999 [Fusarium kuroshium]RSL75454.1 hypothetical protein CEP51_010841 [Fusarium floridanum]RSL92058.1 hypothetical protein CEP52_014048 [Fusarium oligoseptatum]